MSSGGFVRWGILLLLFGAGRAHGAQAVISDFTPKVGAPGDKVIISGSGFTSGAVNIYFWYNRLATVFTNSDLQITATVPSGITTGPIGVQQNGGALTYSTADFQAIGNGPYISDVSPALGSSNDLVVLSGVHFGGVAPTGVKFNGQAGTDATANADGSTINVHVPYGATTGPVSVTTPLGTSNSPSPFTVVGAGPYISGFSPVSGAAGTTVNISGVHFGNATAVRFNGVSAPGFVPTSYTEITVAAPNGVTTGPITVEAPTGTNTTATNFFVSPTVTGFSPAAGRAGTNVTITGTNFLGATVSFNGTQATNVTINNFTIQVKVPAGASSGQIRITTPAGSAFSATNFLMQPTVFGFNPSVGSTGGSIVITGANLNEGLASVKFNNVFASFNPPSAGSVTATVPGTTTGPISVTTSNGTFTTVTNFFLPPTISSFAPTNSAPGTRVTITGQNFIGSTSVSFNGQPATSFNVTNNTSLGATVPANVVSGPITVIAPAGLATSGGLFYGVPVIIGFAPSHGLPGTNVTIFGTNFLGVSAVRFNGIAAVINTVNNGQIIATVPNGAQTGPLTVVTPAGTNSTIAPFTLDLTSDLLVYITNSPNPVSIGSNLLYTITIVNNGPFDAANATLTNTLPAGVRLVSATITAPWVLVTNGNPITGSSASFGNQGIATLLLTVSPQTTGNLIDTIQVGSANADPNPADNLASVITTVEPLAYLSIQFQTNRVKLSWPVALSNYILESRNSFAPGSAWASNSTPPFISGAQETVTETNTDPVKLYRLRR